MGYRRAPLVTVPWSIGVPTGMSTMPAEMEVARPPMVLTRRPRSTRTLTRDLSAGRTGTTNPGPGTGRTDAVRRVAAKLSGRHDVASLFDDVIDEAFELFGVERAGLWRYDTASTRPLDLAAQRGLSPEIVATIEALPRGASTAGMRAIRDGEVRVLDPQMRTTTPALRAVYREIGVRSVCFVPIIFGDEPLGLLVLYHATPYAWTPDELALARAFGDHMGTAIAGARLSESRQLLTDRLTSIAELANRLSRLHDVEAIAWSIVAEAKRFIDHDTIRVYRVDHDTGWCEHRLRRVVPGCDPARCRAPAGTHRPGPDRLGRRTCRERPPRGRRRGSSGRRGRQHRVPGIHADRPDDLRSGRRRGDRRVCGRS